MKNQCWIAVLFLGLTFLSVTYFGINNKVNFAPRPSHLGSLYFLEVPREDAESFAWDLGQITNRGGGYIMGTSLIFKVQSDKECGQGRDLETFLRAYLGTNQFVCYPTNITGPNAIISQ